MIDPLQQDLDDLLRVPELRQKEHRVLSRLLGDLRSRANHHFALQVHMGGVSSYLMSVTLGWVADKVGFAADLPIFRESCDASAIPCPRPLAAFTRSVVLRPIDEIEEGSVDGRSEPPRESRGGSRGLATSRPSIRSARPVRNLRQAQCGEEPRFVLAGGGRLEHRVHRG